VDYKKMMGYGDKKKVTKKQSKPKKNQVLEGIKKELNEWNDTTFKNAPKRWSGAYGRKDGLTEYEQERINEGPAFEYKKHSKKIDKSLKDLQKSYLDLYDSLRKKGLDDEASDFLDNYKKNIVDFTKKYKKNFRKLM
jgi:predicted DNA-binding protein